MNSNATCRSDPYPLLRGIVMNPNAGMLEYRQNQGGCGIGEQCNRPKAQEYKGIHCIPAPAECAPGHERYSTIFQPKVITSERPGHTKYLPTDRKVYSVSSSKVQPITRPTLVSRPREPRFDIANPNKMIDRIINSGRKTEWSLRHRLRRHPLEFLHPPYPSQK